MHGMSREREFVLGNLCARRSQRRGRLLDDFGARSVHQLREALANRTLVRECAILQGALPVERARAQHAVSDELLDALEFLRLRRRTRLRARDACARFPHLLLAGAGNELRMAALCLHRVRTRLRESGLDCGGVEPQQQLALAHGLAFARRDFDDRLLRFRDQLDPVAFERAEQDVGVVAAGRERQGNGCDESRQSLLHRITPRPPVQAARPPGLYSRIITEQCVPDSCRQSWPASRSRRLRPPLRETNR